MVAFNYQKQFAGDVETGKKRQTIRKLGKRNPPKVGNELQLYTGMRTKYCRPLRRSVCTAVSDICMSFSACGNYTSVCIRLQNGLEFVKDNMTTISTAELTRFAQADGFKTLPEFEAWFKSQADERGFFIGYLVEWSV